MEREIKNLIDPVEVASFLESGRTDYKTYEFRDMLNTAKRIESEPVTRGQWTTLSQTCNGYGVLHYYHKECSDHRNASILHSSPFPRCPFCGAFMDKTKG